MALCWARMDNWGAALQCCSTRLAVLLSYEGADIDFVRDIFGFLKANVVDESTIPITNSQFSTDAGVIDANDMIAIISAAKTHQRNWERSVRTLV